jgi:hypothetical protein
VEFYASGCYLERVLFLEGVLYFLMVGIGSIPEPPVVTFDDIFSKEILSRDLLFAFIRRGGVNQDSCRGQSK